MPYIKVILPLKLAWEPYYRTSQSDVRSGMRVTVMFAWRRYVGVVSETDVTPDIEESKILDIISVERHLDPIGEKEIGFWRFLADYYLCSIGEVYKLAYPAEKTSGEVVSAHAEDRREEMRARRSEMLRARLDRLRGSLAKKQEDLPRHHGEKVRADLTARIENLNARIAEIEKMMEEVEESAARREARRRGPAPLSTPAKPLLLEGGEQRLDIVLDRINGTLAEGRNALMLVPDVKLATNLRERLENRFGDALLVFHARESAGRRRSVAAALRADEEPYVILGTPSALFLPYAGLGLIVVEEENDPRYKVDTAPRLNTRDAAVVLGTLHSAQVILSSPAPSLESLCNAVSGRFAHIRVPSDDGYMEIVDTSVEMRKRGMVGNLSRILITHLEECLRTGGKALILRPWGPMEDIADEVLAMFPDAPRDSIRFMTVNEARREPIDGYSLLAIIHTDILLDKQDFRADERLIQILEQFRGRFNGLMVVQTRQGGHPVFVNGAAWSMNLLAERKAFGFPPYSRMVDVIIRDGNPARLASYARDLATSLQPFHPMGPFTPVRWRTPEEGTMALRMMLAKDKSLTGNKKEIAAIIGDFETSRKYIGHITVDVDPV